MLSRQDRQRLEAIESGLIESDPRFAAKFDKLGQPRWLACRGMRPLLMCAVVFLATVAVVCNCEKYPWGERKVCFKDVSSNMRLASTKA